MQNSRGGAEHAEQGAVTNLDDITGAIVDAATKIHPGGELLMKCV